VRRWERRNGATKEVRGANVFPGCAEKTEFPGLGFWRRAKTAPCGDEGGSRRKKSEPGGSMEDVEVHAGPTPGAKVEICAPG
jgi:hypothetical protein